MKFFKKIKSFFTDDRHEEDEYYEDDYYEEDEIDELAERRGKHQSTTAKHTASQQDKSTFRFPLIGDEQQASAETYEEPVQVRKKSAVFYDVEQDTGVKLPAHLPQQSLVYDVEVSNIAELLSKRNKSHGNRSIVRYEQSSLRPRSKGPVTADEKHFLTSKPQREDVVTPVVNREPTAMPSRKRFVPTEVPSPVHGFKKPKPIEELLPSLEQKQQEAKLVSEERAPVKEVSTVEPNEQEQISVAHAETQAEVLAQLTSEKTLEVQQEQPISEVPAILMEDQSESTAIEPEAQPTEPTEVLVEQQQSTDKQETTLNGEQRLQELAVQHLTIENSTVHIEQLRVEQPAPIVQPTIHIEANPAPITADVAVPNNQLETSPQVDPVQKDAQSESVQTNEQANSEKELSTKGSRLPFNVIMLDSDKKKLKQPLSAYGVKSAPEFTITDWKGNVITEPIQAEQIDEPVDKPIVPTDQQMNGTEEVQNETKDSEFPFLSNEPSITEIAVEVQPSTPQATIEASSSSESAVATLVKAEEATSFVNEQIVSELFETELTVDPISLPADEQPQKMEAAQQDEQNSEAIVAEDLLFENEQIEQHPETEAPVLNELVEAALEEPVVEERAKEQAEPFVQVETALIEAVKAPVMNEMEQPTVSVVSPEINKPTEEASAEPIDKVQLYEAYEKPPMDFLLPAEERTEDWAWLDEQAEYLIAALASHQVQAQIESIEQGPAVTQFEITVAQGTKVSKVRNLSDDIKLALAAKDIRIDAPIPGKRSIGIEIPNRVSRAVRLSEVTNSKGFIESDSPLEAALGLDLSGKPVTLDLRKMPHGLIAGATGSGKSVCINSILVSLLYKADPNDLKLLLIDPKMVELAPFNKIPHLVSPVITDVKAATAALKWAVEEMERRYQLFMHAGVRDITRYNQQAENARQFAQKLPYILIVIDELADLMMMAPADVEEAICRIAQKARACGIHLIVATQRPSVDVITGLIKSNIPTRIAFAVSSAIDSRTILDTQGAERLLGRGDMLYLGNGMQAPIRLQGTFVTDDEIEDIIAYVRNQGEPNYLFAQEDLIKRTEMFEEQDELFEEVCRYVHEQGTASTSSVQRNFHIGYNRAARLVDMLEKKGFVSEARGSKPRDVFINESDLDELFK